MVILFRILGDYIVDGKVYLLTPLVVQSIQTILFKRLLRRFIYIGRVSIFKVKIKK